MKVLLREYWPPILTLLLGLLLTTIRLTGFELEYFPGNFGDARFNMYILEHAHQFFIERNSIADSFWSAPFMYPEEHVITYSDNLLGTFIFYSFFRSIGLSVVVSFVSWFIVLTILNFISAYYFIKWLINDKYAASLGAFIFAFSIALMSQVYHAQTFPRFAIPLVFWASILFSKSYQPRYFLLTILLISYQIYSGIYLGFMLLIPIAIYMLIFIVLNAKTFFQKIKDYKYALKILASLIIGLLSLLPLIINYLSRANKVGLKSYETIKGSIPSIQSYFFPVDASYSWSWFKYISPENFESYWNHQIFPGAVAWLSAIGVTIILIFKLKNYSFNFKGQKFILFLTALITFVLFLKVDDLSLYKLVMKIPGFGSMQAIQRIINIELLFFGIATAYIYKKMFYKRKTLVVPFIFMLVILVGDNYGIKERYTKRKIEVAERRVSSLADKMSHLKRKTIVSYEPKELKENSIYYQIDAMLATQKLGLFSVNGYSATCPPLFCPYWTKPNEENRIRWLESRGVDSSMVRVIY